MANTIAISYILNTTDPAAMLGFEAWVDNKKFSDIDHVQAEHSILIEIPDDDGDHELKFILKNKTAEHTQVDKAGNILSDTTLVITDLAFDEIRLGHMFSEHAIYTHNFNSTKETIQDRFYGAMGCNGTVSLKFTTPIYLWLLEHM
jgi:hypothetical protein